MLATMMVAAAGLLRAQIEGASPAPSAPEARILQVTSRVTPLLRISYSRVSKPATSLLPRTSTRNADDSEDVLDEKEMFSLNLTANMYGDDLAELVWSNGEDGLFRAVSNVNFRLFPNEFRTEVGGVKYFAFIIAFDQGRDRWSGEKIDYVDAAAYHTAQSQISQIKGKRQPEHRLC